MNRVLIAAIGSLVLLGLLVAWLTWGPVRQAPVAKEQPARGVDGAPEPQPVELLVYAAASQKVPIEKIARQYESEFPGRTVRLDFGASQAQLAKIDISRGGDLYIPADDSYLALAQQRKLIDQRLPIAQMRPVLVVKAGNPLGVSSVASLLQGSARLALADPDAAAIGKRVRDALLISGMWEALLARQMTTTHGTVVEAANSLRLGAADAALIWDGMLPQYPEFEVVPSPELDSVSARVEVAVLSTSAQPEQARHLARYIASRDRGLAVYGESGFSVVDGPAW